MRKGTTKLRIERRCAFAATEAKRNGTMTRRDPKHHDQYRSNSPAKRRPKPGSSQSPTRAKRGRHAGSQRTGNQSRPTHEPALRRESTSGPGKVERVQKVLAHAGLGSRRSCEDLIKQGRVS